MIPDGTATTITGTGTLEAGEMLGPNTPTNTTVTGMTGTLGSEIIFPAGHIIQIVQGTDKTAVTHGLSTYTNTPYSGLNTKISPKYSTSKILVMLNASVAHYGPGGDTHHVKLQRNPGKHGLPVNAGGTLDIGVGTPTGSLDGTTFSMRLAEEHSMMHQAITYLDSPATTSEVMYGIVGRRNGGAGTAAYNMPQNTSTTDANMARHISIITLMEIAQ